MAAFYEEITLEWAGKTYKVTPTFALIQQIEQKLCLISLFSRVMSGDPPLSHLAELLSMALRAAGCTDKSAAAGEIYREMWSEDNAAKLVEAAGLILKSAVVPAEALPGNVGAPEAGADNPTTSTGENTTKSP